MPSALIRPWPKRYELLDGLRGVACLGVLLHHLGVETIGHYAVMVFFVISGYCITASASSSILRRDSLADYMKRRVQRIYPPYLIAVAFFAITRFARPLLSGGPVWHAGWVEWLQNLTLTQWLSIPLHPIGWPDRNPTLFVAAFWSLNYEEQFYLVTGLLMTLAIRFRTPLATGVLLLGAVGLTWNMAVPGGWVYGLFIEYWAHFALGACVYFVLCEYSRPRIWGVFTAALVLFAAYCLSRILLWHGGAGREEALRVFYELGVLSVVALGLLYARPLSGIVSRSRAWRPIAAVGTISYSLYLVHQFNLHLVATAAEKILPVGAPPAALVAIKAALHLTIATAFWYCCERPFLNRPRRPGRNPEPRVVARAVAEEQA